MCCIVCNRATDERRVCDTHDLRVSRISLLHGQKDNHVHRTHGGGMR